MFARHITMTLKLVGREIRPVFENEILPLLRRQKGFLEEMLFSTPIINEAIALSPLGGKGIRGEVHYPEIVKIINKYVKGLPALKEFEVACAAISVFEKFAKFATV